MAGQSIEGVQNSNAGLSNPQARITETLLLVLEVCSQHPELFLESFDDFLHEPVADHVEIGNSLLVLAGTTGGCLDPVCNETHCLSAVEPVDRELAILAKADDVVSPPARQGAKDHHTLGDGVAPQPPLVDQEVEPLMHRLEASRQRRSSEPACRPGADR